jgi:pimeloyl-ACP methyl ester carboxylesterase
LGGDVRGGRVFETSIQGEAPAKLARSLEEVVEDKTQLSLEGSQLYPVKPFLIQKDEQASFLRELVAVQWRPGDQIYLYVILPKGVKRPPVALYLYSYPSDLERFRNDRLCQDLTAGGVAAVSFCSALTGHRYKNRPMKEWFVSELQEAVVLTVHDLVMVMDYLDTRGDLDTARCGIFGQGSGGTIAILAAALNPRIKAVEVINPWGDWPDWMRKSALVPEEERASFLKPDFLARIRQLDPLEWLAKLSPKPVRLQMILTDPRNPETCLRRILNQAPATAVVDQYPDGRAHAESFKNGTAFDWIKRTLTNLGATNLNSGKSP